MNSQYNNPYILGLIKEALADEDTDRVYYQNLSNKQNNKSDAEILHSMSMDETKHYKMFNDIYYKLTGNRIDPPIKGNVKSISESMLKNYSDSMLSELAKVEEYRKLLFAFLNQEIRDMMTEIIMDEQGHATKLNYLYAEHKTMNN